MTGMPDGCVAQVYVAGRPLYVSAHAVERYFQRVRPSLADEGAALAELTAILPAAAVIATTRPEWAVSDEAPVTDEFVLLGDDIAFPAAGRVMVTCLVVGALSDKTRADRAARRRRRASVRDGIVKAGGKRSDKTGASFRGRRRPVAD